MHKEEVRRITNAMRYLDRPWRWRTPPRTASAKSSQRSCSWSAAIRSSKCIRKRVLAEYLAAAIPS